MLRTACQALETSCCLEVYYDGRSIIGEVHAVGIDKSHKSAVLIFETFDTACDQSGDWQFLPLDEVRELDVSGYFSDAPRPGYRRSDKRFEKVLCEL